jgi:hypothetical protein
LNHVTSGQRERFPGLWREPSPLAGSRGTGQANSQAPGGRMPLASKRRRVEILPHSPLFLTFLYWKRAAMVFLCCHMVKPQTIVAPFVYEGLLAF